jgi:hypothetical protein
MPLAANEAEAYMYAAIHNVSLLALLGTMQALHASDSRWPLDDQFDFLTVGGKYIFPLSLPKAIIHMLEDRLGEANITIVNLQGTFPTKRPEKGSNLWTPGSN